MAVHYAALSLSIDFRSASDYIVSIEERPVVCYPGDGLYKHRNGRAIPDYHVLRHILDNTMDTYFLIITVNVYQRSIGQFLSLCEII